MLDDLLAGAIEDAEARKTRRPLATLEREALAAPAALDATEFLRRGEHIKVIAEVKRASPSRGALASITDPADLAARYEAAGASTVSVLTEERKFKGSLADLVSVRAAVNIPVLRKDFIGLEYQVLEARAAGADLVLLIVAALDQPRLVRLKALIEELGMTALVETHSAEELSRAIDLGSTIIGVNARNLSTFELDRSLFGELAPSIPEGTIKIAESAVANVDDVIHYRNAGADGVLIGEALVTSDPTATLQQFVKVK